MSAVEQPNIQASKCRKPAIAATTLPMRVARIQPAAPAPGGVGIDTKARAITNLKRERNERLAPQAIAPAERCS
jgi:hypothetical protein